MALDRAWIPPAWIAAPIVAFAALVVEHLRVGARRERARRGIAFHERGLARVEDRWAGHGNAGEAFRDPHHLYAEDLDLFGRGSLFERLSTARTASGEQTLAAWLKVPADADTVRRRQEAVAELRPDLDLREDLAILGASVRAGLDPQRLVAWGRAPRALDPAAIAWLGFAAPAATIATAVGAFWLGTGIVPFIAAAAAQGLLEIALRARVERALDGVDRATADLELLAALLARLETVRWTAPALVALRDALVVGEESAAPRIRGLRRRLEWLDSGRNQLVIPLAILLSWRLNCARAIDAWRGRFGGSIGPWIDAVGEIEALCALAGYAFERPADPFPEIVAGPAAIEAEGLGHPLLPDARRVTNDVRLGPDRRALVVSGSNMSGKSTLLRAVGVNTVLGFAGAPVCARRLRLTPLSVGASIRVTDSLLEGSSRFHAELTRLKQVLDRARDAPPLLFLLDEILHGTNSHDRRIGASAVVLGLLRRGAIGLVTTHDLALAEIADGEAGVENVHFVDHLEDGRMTFDYVMHPGVVRKSNALELMRTLGIEV